MLEPCYHLSQPLDTEVTMSDIGRVNFDLILAFYMYIHIYIIHIFTGIEGLWDYRASNKISMDQVNTKDLPHGKACG